MWSNTGAQVPLVFFDDPTKCLLKTLLKKEKMLVMSISPFLLKLFTDLRRKTLLKFCYFYILSTQLYLKLCSVVKGLKGAALYVDKAVAV